MPSMVKVPCPRCKNLAGYSADNPYRPFCSERCKMIDLGNWANEEYNIPSVEPAESENQLSQDSENIEEGLPPRDRRH